MLFMKHWSVDTTELEKDPLVSRFWLRSEPGKTALLVREQDARALVIHVSLLRDRTSQQPQAERN